MTGTTPTGTLEFDYDCNGTSEPSPSATNADCDQTSPCYSNVTMSCGAAMGPGGCGDVVGGRDLFVYSGSAPACGSLVTRHSCTSGTCPSACTVNGTFAGTVPFECR
jgi:hypothetical protein